jgi:hypothetical protein
MHRLSSWVEERSAPVFATALIVVAGLAYTIWWTATAHHGWQSVSDLWNSAEISLGISHGHWGMVYGPGSQLDSPPGFEFLLAPFMALGHAVGFKTAAEASPHYPVFWLVLAPTCTVLASSVLFALDAVARHWALPEGRRLALCLVAGAGVVSATVFWGHPEDCVALALVIWAALAVERAEAGGLRRAAWLLGLAVACQPLALLAVAPVVARFGWRSLGGVAWRVALPSVVVVLPELVTHAGRTLHQIVDQPFLPVDESSTPFTHLARSLGHGMYGGGTLRLVATVLAVGVGWLACRGRVDLPWVLVVMAAAFTLRVAFESELLGFYFYPVVALSLLLTARARSWSWFSLCSVLSVVNLVVGNRREHAIALWWPAMLLTTLAMLALAYRCVRSAPVRTTESVEDRGAVAERPVPAVLS